MFERSRFTIEGMGVGLGAGNGQSLERLANIGQYRKRIVGIRPKGLIKMWAVYEKWWWSVQILLVLDVYSCQMLER